MESLMILIIGMVVVYFIYVIFESNLTNKSWRRAADGLGLHFSSSDLFSNRSITGMYKDRYVQIRTYSEAWKNYTTVQIKLSNVPVQLELNKEDLRRSVGTSLENPKVEVDEESLRDALLNGSDRQRIRSYLTDERMSKLTRFFRYYPHSEINQSELRAVKEDIIQNRTQVMSMCDRTVRIARLLEGKQTEDEPQEGKRMQNDKRAEEEGNIPEIQEPKQNKGIMNTERNDVEALTQKAHREYVAQNYSAAADFYREALRWQPDDPDIQKNYKRAARKSGASENEVQDVFEKFGISPQNENKREPKGDGIRSPTGSGEQQKENETDPQFTAAEDHPTPTSASDHEPGTVEHPTIDSNLESISDSDQPKRPSSQENPKSNDVSNLSSDHSPQEPPEPNSPSPNDDLDQTAVLQKLFNPRSTSVNAAKVFEEYYKGKLVSWTGTFLKSKDLSLSMKFDSTEGDLIKVRLQRGKQETDVKRDCYGLVHVPDGLPNNLKEGKRTQFRGTLFRLDKFMRNLYISDATLQTD